MIAPAELVKAKALIAPSSPEISPLDPNFKLLSLFKRWSELEFEQKVKAGTWEVTMNFNWHGGKFTKAEFDFETRSLQLEWNQYKDKMMFLAPFAVAEMVVLDPYKSYKKHHCLVIAGRETDKIVVLEDDGNVEKINTKYHGEVPLWLGSHFLFANSTKNEKKIKDFILVEAS